MKPRVTDRSTCRLCESKNLLLAAELVPTPLGDEFIPASLLNQPQVIYDHHLMLCVDCANVQLRQVVDPDIIYRKYIYTTSVSLGLKEHFKQAVDSIVTRVCPRADALVVEIGSNEGAMLRAFKARGFRVLGIDPATDIAASATASGVETLPTYFTRELGESLRRERGPAGLVVANYVLANVDDFRGLVTGVRALLADDGVMLMETSYCLDVVQHDLIDTIFHEHLSYFAVAPLAIFFKSLGMELIDAEAIPTKGGSIRVTAQLASGPRKTSPAVAEFITREKAAGLDRPEAYAAMHGRLDRLRHELHDLLAPLKSSGRKISAYGAAVGLTTMIYQFGLGPYLSCIFDDNRGKFGLYSPGLHLPCLDSSEIYRLKPDVIIVLAWRYATTIVEMHHQFLREGGTFVIPLSEVRVVSEGSPLPKRP